MQLSVDAAQATYQIQGYDTTSIQVNHQRITQPLIISPEVLITPWSVANIAQLQALDLAPLLALNPHIVLLGTGASLRFPEQTVLQLLTEQGIGVEVMDTPAACRTYVALAAEGRQVAAGLFIP